MTDQESSSRLDSGNDLYLIVVDHMEDHLGGCGFGARLDDLSNDRHGGKVGSGWRTGVVHDHRAVEAGLPARRIPGVRAAEGSFRGRDVLCSEGTGDRQHAGRDARAVRDVPQGHRQRQRDEEGARYRSPRIARPSNVPAGLGDIDNAFLWMHRAAEARDPMLTPIQPPSHSTPAHASNWPLFSR